MAESNTTNDLVTDLKVFISDNTAAILADAEERYVELLTRARHLAARVVSDERQEQDAYARGYEDGYRAGYLADDEEEVEDDTDEH